MAEFLQAVSRIDGEMLAEMMRATIPIGEERRALSSACVRVLASLAVNGWLADEGDAAE